MNVGEVLVRVNADILFLQRANTNQKTAWSQFSIFTSEWTASPAEHPILSEWPLEIKARTATKFLGERPHPLKKLKPKIFTLNGHSDSL